MLGNGSRHCDLPYGWQSAAGLAAAAAEAISALAATATPSAIRADFNLAVRGVSIPLLVLSILG